MSTSLYNKLRPTEFNEVVGQELICKLLSASIDSDSLHHSIIMYGEKGVGKTSVSRIIASKIASPEDIHEKDSAVYGKVDDIRSLQSDFNHLPWAGKYKVFIFDEAHRISNLGFDCLLKSIEEPPPHVKFIFVTTSFQQIPPTIKSRSLCLQLNKIDSKDIYTYLKKISSLEKFKFSDTLLKDIASAAKGSLRDALVLIEAANIKTKENVPEDIILKTLGLVGTSVLLEFVWNYLVGNFSTLYTLSKDLISHYVDEHVFINELQQVVIDTRLSLAFVDKVDERRADVTTLLKAISKYVEKSTDRKKAKTIINSKLDYMRQIGIEFEKNIRVVNNKDVLVFGFLVDLSKAPN